MKKILLFLALLAAPAVLCFGQATTAAGTIQGTIQDATGAVLPGATVTITNDETGAAKTFTTNSSGSYTSGPIIPGHYTVTVSAPSFSTIKAKETVQIGNVTNGSLKLSVGSATTEVDVQGSDVRVDTAQSEVQGVISAAQIDNLPINGRNFLDLAQLEPGVQLQDGQDFDPTKAGYSSVSFNGIFGRTARLSLDGQDISDETVGTTTLNVSSTSIDEAQIARSSLDLSNEITSSGSVIISTRSGGNRYHGQAYYAFRDARAGFALSPGGVFSPFQRNAFGGGVGGFLIKDKLFFFVSSDRIKQDAGAALQFGSPFQTASGTYDATFRDTYNAGRIDFNAPKGVHLFFRFAYEYNGTAGTYGLGYSRYLNRDNTPGYVGGADFVTGKFTHQIRYSYLKFHNFIADDSAGTYNPVAGIELDGNGGLITGPNYLAPQATYQSDKQESYNGSYSLKSHQIRFGVSMNRIEGGGLADFFGLAPLDIISSKTAVADTVNGVTYPVGSSTNPNPKDYPAFYVIFGNGQGYFTEKQGFNLPGGGQSDWRTHAYISDSWKVIPGRLTVNYGIGYDRDTGRTDSDLAPMPCSDAVAAFGAFSPCTTGRLLDSLSPGLGAPVRQPNENFGPSLGVAYDPTGSGKTVFRGGIGIYYENSIFNNTLFDRPGKLKSGLFNAENYLCGPFGTSFPLPNGKTLTSINGVSLATVCSDPASVAAPYFAALQAQYQAATKAAGAAANPNYIPSNLTNSSDGDSIYAPGYRSPRSVEINLGVQHELWKGAVFTADYVRNIGEHFEQAIDQNRVGAARTLNIAAAQAAITATLANCGATSIGMAIATNCGGMGGGYGSGQLTIADFAANGLDSGNTYLNGGYPIGYFGGTPAQGAAFPGVNPLWGDMKVFYPNGRSVYNGLQTNFRQQKANPIKGISNSNFEASYSFSRFVSTSSTADQFFGPGVYDYDNPTGYIGPSGLDRTHQLSFGGFFLVKHGPQIGLIGHVFSSFAGNLRLQADPSGAPGEIFRTDVTGDGTTGDLVPGTQPGQFMRGVKGSSINRLIDNYNQTAAGHITPAGQALVDASLFTPSQLAALGGVTPAIARAPSNQVSNGWLRTFDLSLGYPIHIKWLGEGTTLSPSVSFFNLFNFANFGSVGGTLQSTADLFASNAGTISQAPNTTDPTQRTPLRANDGTGTFAVGAGRQTEYGLKLVF